MNELHPIEAAWRRFRSGDGEGWWTGSSICTALVVSCLLKAVQSYGLALGAIGKVGAEILKKGDVSEKRQDLPKLDTIPDWIERGLSGNEYFSDESANAKFWLNGSIRRLDEMKARLARTLHEDADLFRQKTLSDIPNEKEICGRLYQMLFSLC